MKEVTVFFIEAGKVTFYMNDQPAAQLESNFNGFLTQGGTERGRVYDIKDRTHRFVKSEPVAVSDSPVEEPTVQDSPAPGSESGSIVETYVDAKAVLAYPEIAAIFFSDAAKE